MQNKLLHHGKHFADQGLRFLQIITNFRLCEKTVKCIVCCKGTISEKGFDTKSLRSLLNFCNLCFRFVEIFSFFDFKGFIYFFFHL